MKESIPYGFSGRKESQNNALDTLPSLPAISNKEETEENLFFSLLSWFPKKLFSFFWILVVIGLSYRLKLLFQLFADQDELFRVSATWYNTFWLLSLSWQEIALSFFVFSWLALALWLFRKLRKTPFHRELHAIVEFLLGVFVLLFSVLLAAHLRLMFTMSTGVSYEVLMEGQTALSWIGLYKQTFWVDYASVVFGMVCFFVIPRLSFFHEKKAFLSLFFFFWGCTGISFLFLFLPKPSLSVLIEKNPIVFTLSSFGEHFTQKRIAKEQEKEEKKSVTLPLSTSFPKKKVALVVKKKKESQPPKSQELSNSVDPIQESYWEMDPLKYIHWVGSSFLQKSLPSISKKKILSSPKKKWNVLMIVLESTGLRYIRDTSLGNREPMPFLNRIISNSLFLSNHYSSANSSPRAVFSLFSGLYPMPQPQMFSLRKSNQLPALPTFLGKEKYKQFLVTPGAVKWYFPKHFLHSSGLHDMEGYFSLPLQDYGPSPKEGRNELDVARYFSDRLKKEAEPFFATYISFAPHYPYFDYGPLFQILPNKKKRIHRYFNNLVVLDKALEIIFKGLRESGKDKNTVVVMVGDHSEAFGQHPENWIHSRFSYNENLQVPALFYQPQLFKPQVIAKPTSHVDILPTLLDVLNLPYEPLLFQGESLLRFPLQRKYIFAYGNEDTLSSISRKNQKLQWDKKTGKCWWFDLQVDPNEKRKKSCHLLKEQWKATEEYGRGQPSKLIRYNQQWKKNKGFGSLSHPTLR